SIIDGAGDSVIDSSVLVGLSPIALAYNSTNNKIYCANKESYNISIIDGAGDSVVDSVVVGDYPYTLAYNSTDNKIYCANYNDSTVSVIACSPGTAVEEDQETEVIPNFSLKQNYPNPFNPTTKILFTVYGSRFMVHRPIHTTLKIYNILGQKVRTLVDEPKGARSYEVIWDGKDDKGKEVASGIYFYQLKAGDFIETKKMLLLK
ncbi:MAG: T9SS type A sorting domain-containing protein, partial [Candidatus Zixiibacteriota bacterium]